ncbi:hypothetical protein B0H11DRAFT_1908342 [Mycena galericulata]|nr:hypothetical protein B0H11DRAFT_1908342 [Mycena galericulata]
MYWALPPRNAIFSGYTMDYNYFQKLVLALSPDLATICRDDGPQPFEMYVCEYDTWRTRLPQEELEKAPILKVCQTVPHPVTRPVHGLLLSVFNFSWEEDPDANTKFFFATRSSGKCFSSGSSWQFLAQLAELAELGQICQLMPELLPVSASFKKIPLSLYYSRCARICGGMQ